MTITGDPSSPPIDGPRYGRFLRRFQAAVIDVIVILLAIYGAVFIAVTLNSENLARTLGFSIAIGWLLYEPVLVALTGSTVGHYLCNLRVVDNRTGGNINFFKAVARTLLKAVLGWLSFITMATTRRHQAIHDLATGSTVQIRNLAQASPASLPRRTDRAVERGHALARPPSACHRPLSDCGHRRLCVGGAGRRGPVLASLPERRPLYAGAKSLR